MDEYEYIDKYENAGYGMRRPEGIHQAIVEEIGGGSGSVGSVGSGGGSGRGRPVYGRDFDWEERERVQLARDRVHGAGGQVEYGEEMTGYYSNSPRYPPHNPQYIERRRWEDEGEVLMEGEPELYRNERDVEYGPLHYGEEGIGGGIARQRRGIEDRRYEMERYAGMRHGERGGEIRDDDDDPRGYYGKREQYDRYYDRGYENSEDIVRSRERFPREQMMDSEERYTRRYVGSGGEDLHPSHSHAHAHPRYQQQQQQPYYRDDEIGRGRGRGRVKGEEEGRNYRAGTSDYGMGYESEYRTRISMNGEEEEDERVGYIQQPEQSRHLGEDRSKGLINLLNAGMDEEWDGQVSTAVKKAEGDEEEKGAMGYYDEQGDGREDEDDAAMMLLGLTTSSHGHGHGHSHSHNQEVRGSTSKERHSNRVSISNLLSMTDNKVENDGDDIGNGMEGQEGNGNDIDIGSTEDYYQRQKVGYGDNGRGVEREWW
ncbi:hypothetical protein AX774_g5416 [Zancudomyces culisetae]|uniref:Uncharacterized protein n=1 Tax=Zancudomyces culisetae TaxID=1213189 RepID=A0A1R1PJI5_ZANCU|nr:hypothetical protein AX774_g5416 [Zancudomyces culisetae]|eukprot:OMH81128.1 hypothetical protein AX774_g5416 [Zancudomyces culisetae]